MARNRRTAGGRFRPSAFFAAKQAALDVLGAAARLGLAVPGAAYGLYGRLVNQLYDGGSLKTYRPAVPAVGVGGLSPECRGRVLLTSWLIGWAAARGLTPAVTAPLRDAGPSEAPCRALPASDVLDVGVEPALLARYNPAAAILADEDPVRAAKAAAGELHPDFLLLQDAFSDRRVARDLDLVLLDAVDLGQGWNRPWPRGAWREDASALFRASALLVFAGPAGLDAAMHQAEARLQDLAKPIFGLTFSIWRFRSQTGTSQPGQLAESPYMGVFAESDRATLPEMFKEAVGAAPRLSFFFPDRHRFTRQDIEHIAADASRLRSKNILTSPRMMLKLKDALDKPNGPTLWTYDPEVAFGPTRFAEGTFLSWWEAAFAALTQKNSDTP